MTAVVVVTCAVLGLVVGSFLNVVIHRVPAGSSVVSPPSACPGCGQRVRPRDNVPVLSWLVLRGGCRDCGMRISARYPAVELATSALFAAVGAVVGVQWHLPAFLYLAAIGVALTAIDLDVRRLPDAIVLPSYLVGAALLTAASGLEGDWAALLRAAVGAVALYGLYLALAVAKPGGMGFGDVKLAGVLGLHLAWVGWAELAVGTFAAFVLGGLVGVAMIAVGRAGRQTHLPFGPFMLAGAALGLLLGGDLTGWYLGVLVP